MKIDRVTFILLEKSRLNCKHCSIGESMLEPAMLLEVDSLPDIGTEEEYSMVGDVNFFRIPFSPDDDGASEPEDDASAKFEGRQWLLRWEHVKHYRVMSTI